MTEKVLGFKRKNATRYADSIFNNPPWYAVDEPKLTPVISLEDYEIMRKSERAWRLECSALKRKKVVPVVSLKWLKEYCKKNWVLKEQVVVIAKELIKAAEKEASQKTTKGRMKDG